MLIAMCRFFVAAVVCMVAGLSAFAAEVTVGNITIQPNSYGNRCLVAHVSLKGEITKGDAGRLAVAIAEVDKAAIAQNSSCWVNDQDTRRLIYVELQSPGGLYSEGWKIAKLVSAAKTVAATYVSKDSFCYSACAIAFLGGAVPAAEDTIIMRRILHPTAKLGFHAPFPMLEDNSYTGDDVKEFFLSAFTLVSEFMKDARRLGIKSEVAQLLLQPTPTQFYEINSSGRALLTNVTISAAPVTFSVRGTGLKAITAQNILNLCYNNQVLRASGDVTEMVTFLEHRKGGKSFISVKTKTHNYFGTNDLPTEVMVVPVADAGEGEVLSCVAIVASMPDADNPDERMKFACLGFKYGDKEIADKITQVGAEWLWSDRTEGCDRSSKLALLPWATKLTDIPPAYLDD